jgi:hypothetical protein
LAMIGKWSGGWALHAIAVRSPCSRTDERMIWCKIGVDVLISRPALSDNSTCELIAQMDILRCIRFTIVVCCVKGSVLAISVYVDA